MSLASGIGWWFWGGHIPMPETGYVLHNNDNESVQCRPAFQAREEAQNQPFKIHKQANSSIINSKNSIKLKIIHNIFILYGYIFCIMDTVLTRSHRQPRTIGQHQWSKEVCALSHISSGPPLTVTLTLALTGLKANLVGRSQPSPQSKIPADMFEKSFCKVISVCGIRYKAADLSTFKLLKKETESSTMFAQNVDCE